MTIRLVNIGITETRCCIDINILHKRNIPEKFKSWHEDTKDTDLFHLCYKRRNLTQVLKLLVRYCYQHRINLIIAVDHIIPLEVKIYIDTLSRYNTSWYVSYETRKLY